MRGRFFPRLINFMLLAFSITLGLLLCEALVRRFVPQELPLSILLRGLYIPHPQIGYVLKPGFRRHVETRKFDADIEISALGLREQPIQPKQSQVQRILALGDSFTFGVHAGSPESTYVKKLELAVQRTLSDQQYASEVSDAGPARHVEIINAGVEGYGTEQAFLLLQDLAPKLQPDAVLLAFYLGNDFTDNAGHTRMTVVSGYLMLEASAEPYLEYARPWHRRIRLELHAHSQLYVLLKRALIQPASIRAEKIAAGERQTAGQVPRHFVYDAGFANSMRRQPSEVMLEAIANTQVTLHHLREWCEERGVALLMFAIPARQQVDAAERIRWLNRFGLAESEFDFRLPNERLRRLANEAGIPLVDLTEIFTERTAAGEQLHVENDNHWNARGHDLAARSLLEPTLQYLCRPAALIGTR